MVIHGTRDSGKTAACLRIARYFRFDGLKIANLTIETGMTDIPRYWADKTHHFILPLEATKGRVSLENWLPIGYDLYILESELPDSDIISKGVYTLFHPEEQNICIPQYLSRDETTYGCRPIISLCHPGRVPLEYPATDVLETIFSPELIHTIQVNPRMVLPRLYGKILSAGYYPSELWEIYPDLQWVHEDLDSFWIQYESRHPDLIVLGWVRNPMEWREVLEIECPILCFDPRIWQDNFTPFEDITPDEITLENTAEIVRNDPVGTPLPDVGILKRYNNEYWVNSIFQELPLISKHKNITIVNGWVHPQYLIQEGVISDTPPGETSAGSCSSQLQHISPNRRRR